MSRYVAQVAGVVLLVFMAATAPAQVSSAPAEPVAPAPADAAAAPDVTQSLSEVEQWIRSGQEAGTQAAPAAGSLDAARRWLAPDPDPVAVLELTPDTLVDWTTFTLRALASAPVPAGSLNPARSLALAQREAAVQARRRLLDTVLALPLTGEARVAQGLVPAERAAQLRGLVQNSRLDVRTLAPEGETDGRCTAVATLSLLGPAGELITPLVEPFLSSIPSQTTLQEGLALPPPGPAAEGDPAYRASMAELGGYTGVLVDARGLGLRPAWLQRVVDAAGLGAYGAFCVGRSAATGQGLALFIADRTDPRVAGRLGASPLYVRALAVSGGSDLVVSQADGDLMRSSFAARGDRPLSPLVVLLDRTDLTAASSAAASTPAAPAPATAPALAAPAPAAPAAPGPEPAKEIP